ncbi:hypothetical protein AVEN_7017-1 [Araneus ventricosus]|uniref:Uncharacterized protein n=1 Tax=Araneus ventricosus TaxID=182803 RepID=A0A4Y2IER9_ARAVE|nr:hypothetical protein AVEN_7017-1 [Araneus ventricosus]
MLQAGARQSAVVRELNVHRSVIHSARQSAVVLVPTTAQLDTRAVGASRFNIQNDSRREMIWREPGIRYRAPNIVERDHYRGGGLLVWVGIATNCRTDLYVFAGGFRHSCPISRRNPIPSCAAFYRCDGYRRDIYGR